MSDQSHDYAADFEAAGLPFRPTVITAPQPFFPSMYPGKHSIYLAGAIDMDAAVDWQRYVIDNLHDVDCVIINPRRAAFTPDTLDEQILWELDVMEKADTILMWFPASSKAPVAMFETGIYLQSGKLVVGAEEGFYCRRNLELTLDRFNVNLYSILADVITAITDRVYLGSRLNELVCIDIVSPIAGIRQRELPLCEALKVVEQLRETKYAYQWAIHRLNGTLIAETKGMKQAVKNAFESGAQPPSRHDQATAQG